MAFDVTDPYHKRLRDFEVFDRIELQVIPRYKTSGLSGDEWRQSVRVSFYFKGLLIDQKSYHTIEDAAAYLPSLIRNPEGLSREYLAHEDGRCDQPSCAQKAVGRFELKRETAHDGNYLEPTGIRHFRRFCLLHVERGDASREDADANYIPLDKVGPSDSQNNEESPAVFGGVIDLTANEQT